MTLAAKNNKPNKSSCDVKSNDFQLAYAEATQKLRMWVVCALNEAAMKQWTKESWLLITTY